VYNSSLCPIPDTCNKKEYTIKSSEVKRFASLYERHLKLLKLQGKSDSTISAYSRAVRRIRDRYDCCPDTLTKEQLESYFVDLVESHSWSTVKLDRLGLMFFWKVVLGLDWQWLNSLNFFRKQKHQAWRRYDIYSKLSLKSLFLKKLIRKMCMHVFKTLSASIYYQKCSA
jgi:hypothetical protein